MYSVGGGVTCTVWGEGWVHMYSVGGGVTCRVWDEGWGHMYSVGGGVTLTRSHSTAARLMRSSRQTPSGVSPGKMCEPKDEPEKADTLR